MRNIFLLSVFSIALITASCSTARKTANQKEGYTLTDKRWILTELEGKEVPGTINGKVPYIIFHKKDSSYSATAGCNGMGGTFNREDDKHIKFKLGPSTLMACQNMEFEQGLAEALKTTEQFNINGNTLTLLSNNNTSLAKFRTQTLDDVAQQLNGTWELTYISGPRITFEALYPSARPTITFALPGETAHGSGSCNNYNAGFKIDGNSILFSGVISTKKGCPGSGESTYFSILKTVTGYSVSGNILSLLHDEVTVMRFEKKN